ncbi:MAG: cobalamin biosynthesis protein CobD [Curvibacter sp. RIFCSPHIGHO2_12_FULL_63_18]|uniref:adenosylcobinamide-phosphate synthase CbiB n=1 Tax=Rhodoferax sp. TaxID=50421 RepID=UPI0008C3485B|nr:adenosylcobinamide-phosphate synthase CbiB [Rhodoferax sp.]OGO96998.1 MAG: cobalamin biosynthesis protein CobD [Curvibacter sp. GWA2_63_95]OGP01175.1 MAG: cobalamin biosynthesis protein CobD [Curvibacter sp. RIFCSPHIGHO2_12_FULL_63_18]HCX79986.1 cobalamin biosynthesis protein CobD [Rhodoferax sp.]
MLAMALALLVALAVDRWWGEPRLRLHPVVWMGNYLGAVGAWVQRHAVQQPERRDWKAFWLAALVWIAGAAMVSGAAWALQAALLMLPWWAAGLGLGLALKPLLAWAMLHSEVQAVEAALGQSLAAGRERLRWLVSREVAQLTDTQVRESAIETLAENLNDSVVAPIFWFVLLGLPGAALYRFANTADAMWGYPGVYKGQNWAWAGKWAARVDDVLSWLPARITALLLLLVTGVRGAGLARQLPAQARQTPSPNSGWPMAAMALNLDVALRKPGVYVLNPQGRAAVAADTAGALVYASKALLALVVITQAAMVLIVWGARR